MQYDSTPDEIKLSMDALAQSDPAAASLVALRALIDYEVQAQSLSRFQHAHSDASDHHMGTPDVKIPAADAADNHHIGAAPDHLQERRHKLLTAWHELYGDYIQPASQPGLDNPIQGLQDIIRPSDTHPPGTAVGVRLADYLDAHKPVLMHGLVALQSPRPPYNPS